MSAYGEAVNSTRATRPFGSWPSPISPADVAAGTAQLEELRLDGDATYWLASRPDQGGRVTLMRHDGGSVTDLLPDGGWNVRSRVHEMGGGAYAVADGLVVFSRFDDNRLYRLEPGSDGQPTAITPEAKVRYGGLALHGRQLYAVREDHRADGEPRNELVRLDVDGANDDLGAVLSTGSDFVGTPAVSADGGRLAWVTWDHPHMPWDTTTLWTAETTEDGIDRARRVAGGDGISVTQPAFAADGTLWFVSDETGWWTLWRTTATGTDLALDVQADLAEAQWLLGMRDLAPVADGRLLIRHPDATGGPAVFDPRSGAVEALAPAARTRSLVSSGDAFGYLCEHSDRPAELVRVDGGAARVLATAGTAPDAAYVSVPDEVSWTNSAGLTAYGYFSAPVHPEVGGADDEAPPLLVLVHGGPTSRSDPVESAAKRFWTSRGFALLDVNYGGSSGYGRAYRERLRGQWGVVDIDDIVTGARAMAERGLVDGGRMAIRGGSAGGYATLRALTSSDAFAAGTSYFGISDLRALAADTHKFEARYCDGLIGPLPEAEQVYVERSPLSHLDALHGDLLLLQGADDLIVPLNQAEAMADAVRAAGKPVEMVVYDGEGHGFRRAESTIDAHQRELAHYGRVFGFEPAP